VSAFATPLNQLKMKPIFKDSKNTVYFSPDWVSKIKGKILIEATVLFDFNTASNHSKFEGNQPYISSETRNVINCKDKSIAFRGERTYENKMAAGKELNYGERRFSVIEFNKLSELEQVTDFSIMEIDNSYKEIIKSACAKSQQLLLLIQLC
jgi:hypothetical protein